MNDSMAVQEEPQIDLTKFNLTDLGNAERLIMRYGEDLRYCATWKKWLRWDSRRWKIDHTGEVHALSCDTVREMLALGADLTKSVDQTTKNDGLSLVHFAIKSEAKSKITAMVDSAKTMRGTAITHDVLDQDRWMLNVRNGMINLKNGRLLPHDRAHLLTKTSLVDFIPGATCPTFDGFLSSITGGNTALADYIQRVFGYALTGNTDEQCFFFLHGNGANGKSTLMRVLFCLLGEYATAAAPGLLASNADDKHPTAIADLVGARVVIAPETNQGKGMSEVVLKQITGGDKMKARRMNEDFWDFDVVAKLFITGNHKPNIRGTDDGIWRRVKLIPFEIKIPNDKIDHNLSIKLHMELPGILNWALRGCLGWQRLGSLAEPLEVTKAIDEYREDEDSFGRFLADCCNLGSDRKVTSAEFSKSYLAWCTEEGEKYPLTSKIYGAELRKRGCTSRKLNHKRHWFGVDTKSGSEE